MSVKNGGGSGVFVEIGRGRWRLERTLLRRVDRLARFLVRGALEVRVALEGCHDLGLREAHTVAFACERGREAWDRAISAGDGGGLDVCQERWRGALLAAAFACTLWLNAPSWAFTRLLSSPPSARCSRLCSIHWAWAAVFLLPPASASR